MHAVVKILVRFCASVAVTDPVCPELITVVASYMERAEEMALSSRFYCIWAKYGQFTLNDAYDPSSKIFKSHCMTVLYDSSRSSSQPVTMANANFNVLWRSEV